MDETFFPPTTSFRKDGNGQKEAMMNFVFFEKKNHKPNYTISVIFNMCSLEGE